MSNLKLRLRRIENGYDTKLSLSKALDLSWLTYYRKEENPLLFNCKEMNKIIDLLNLNKEDILDIFLDNKNKEKLKGEN